MQRDYGTSMLDFGTVGKDLLTCSVTDDIELVHKNMVSLQIELNLGKLWLDKMFEAEWQDAMELYNDWLQTNNVGDYQILRIEKIYIRKTPIRNCISHDFKRPENLLMLSKQTPK